MPELPEAEVVRRGLARWATDAVAAELEVLDPRSLRRSPGGADALRERLRGARLAEPARRGKFLWLPLAEGDDAVVVHLGMSGQILVDEPGAADQRHLRLRLPVTAADGSARELRFVDQRIFGGWWLDALRPDDAAGGERIERAGVAGALRIEQPLEHGDGLRRGHADRLVDDEPAVHVALLATELLLGLFLRKRPRVVLGVVLAVLRDRGRNGVVLRLRQGGESGVVRRALLVTHRHPHPRA